MGLAAVVLVIWIYLWLGRGRFWRVREGARAAERGTGNMPRVVAVVPARNEAAVVGLAVESLAKQRYSGAFHIVLVDDQSDDGTAARARAAAAPETLTVVEAAPLPKGWTGKLWAVAQGIECADGLQPDYLLLTDADIVHAPGQVAELVARAGGGYDLVSNMATLRCQSLAERALVPAFVFFFFMLYPPAWGTAAAGGCMLVRRAALARVGGIEAIRGAWIDDCALARAIRGGGGRVWLGPSRGTRSIREYGSFADVGRMISRSAYAQLHYSPWLLAGTVMGMLLVFGAPPALALGGGSAGVVAMGAAAWGLMSLLYLPMLRFYRVSPFWAPLLPAVAVFYLGATFDSAIRHWRGRGAVWKGRVHG